MLPVTNSQTVCDRRIKPNMIAGELKVFWKGHQQFYHFIVCIALCRLKAGLCFRVALTPWLRFSPYSRTSTCCPAVHARTKRGIWLCLCIVSEGLVSDSLVFSWSDSEQRPLSWSGIFWKWSLLILKPIVENGWIWHSWFVHVGASTRKGSFATFKRFHSVKICY